MTVEVKMELQTFWRLLEEKDLSRTFSFQAVGESTVITYSSIHSVHDLWQSLNK